MTKRKTLRLKNDLVFKEFFGRRENEEYLKDFLSALLKRKINRIQIQKDFSMSKENVTRRNGILDIRAVVDDKKIINIEMQVSQKEDFLIRAEYYASKLTSSELKVGEAYEKIKPVIVVAILNYNFFEFEEYVSEIVSVFKSHKECEIKTMHKYYFIELPKYRKSKNAKTLESKLDQWLTFIDGEDKKGEEVAMSKNAVIKEAQEELDYLTGDEKIARLEELREKEVKDRMAIEKYGIKIGEERGIKIGIKKGVIEGRKLEQIESKKRIAKRMKELKIDTMLILNSTGLSISQIKKL